MSDAPRWLDRDAVAAYLRLRVEAVDRMARDGRLPQPSYTLGPRNPRWDRETLDDRMGRGIASTDADTAFEALYNGQKETRHPHRQAHAR